jgi:hypothetical protein
VRSSSCFSAELRPDQLREATGVGPLFYRLQMALTLTVGALLTTLPAYVVESPEPLYTAETLMRRSAGLFAFILVGGANFLLLGASQRDRLGASTFKALNGATAGVTALVCFALSRRLHRILFFWVTLCQ